MKTLKEAGSQHNRISPVNRASPPHMNRLCRTREQPAEQKFTRDHWRKQVSRVRRRVERFYSRVPGENRTREQKLLKHRSTQGQIAYANGHE